MFLDSDFWGQTGFVAMAVALKQNKSYTIISIGGNHGNINDKHLKQSYKHVVVFL